MEQEGQHGKQNTRYKKQNKHFCIGITKKMEGKMEAGTRKEENTRMDGRTRLETSNDRRSEGTKQQARRDKEKAKRKVPAPKDVRMISRMERVK